MTPDSEREPGKLETDLAALVSRSRRVLWLVVVSQGAILTLAIVAIILLAFALARAETRISGDEGRLGSVQAETRLALCDSEFTIASAPLPATTSKFGVEFVEASRKAFIVLDCPGNLGPPSAALAAAAARTGVVLRY